MPDEVWRNAWLELSAPAEKGRLKNKEDSTQKKLLPLIMQYHPALPNLKNILMGKWHLIQNPIAKKSYQSISWSELISEYRSIKSLADGRVVLPACQYF